MGRWRLSLILDTHTFVWWLTGDPKLSQIAIDHITGEHGSCYVSAVTAFELTNKMRLGKFEAAREIVERLDALMHENGFDALPITMAHATLAGQLASAHRDPFDRLLAAQAIIQNCPVVTKDAEFRDLGAEVVW